MVKVMAFGTFDVLHHGHEEYLRQAKDFGDFLLVVVSRDVNTERLKGEKPHLSEDERLKAISECAYVDKAVLGNKKDIYKVVVDEKPDVICLGYDQRVDERELEKELLSRGFKSFRIVRAKAFKPELYKSSKLKK
ncbi:FAD synthase [Candidatus Woesearchaeota archaeon]|nr:FAD synthase [Candidatus Woesearchaeota archaeon]